MTSAPKAPNPKNEVMKSDTPESKPPQTAKQKAVAKEYKEVLLKQLKSLGIDPENFDPGAVVVQKVMGDHVQKTAMDELKKQIQD